MRLGKDCFVKKGLTPNKALDAIGAAETTNDQLKKIDGDVEA